MLCVAVLALDEMSIDCFAESSNRWGFEYRGDGKRNIETPVNTALDPKEVQRTQANVKNETLPGWCPRAVYPLPLSRHPKDMSLIC